MINSNVHDQFTEFSENDFLLEYLVRGLSQITFALRVGRWSEKRVVYYIKSAN